MPIKTLDRKMRPPRLGVIHLGVQVPNKAGEGMHPEEVPYFVCPPDLATRLGDEQPTAIRCLLPSSSPDVVLSAHYETWGQGPRGGRYLLSRCDGERCVTIPAQGNEVVGACRRVYPDGAASACECKGKALARLNVIPLAGPIGIYQVVMGGEQRIADVLMELRTFAAVLGSLTEIEGKPILFEIVRIPVDVQIRQADGKRIAKKGYPVHVRCLNVSVAGALAARGQVMLGEGAPLAALPPRDEEGDVVGTDAGSDSAEDLWTILLDRNEGKPALALAAFRRDAVDLVGRPVESLSDLTPAEVRAAIRALAR